MKPIIALRSAPRAERPPLAAWSWEPAAGVLTITDAHGFATDYRVLQLDDAGSAWELVEAGQRFGESVLVLLDGRHSLCSCSPDADPSHAPCEHALALLSLQRARSRAPPG